MSAVRKKLVVKGKEHTMRKRKIILALAVVMIMISVLSFPVEAANTADISIINFSVPNSYRAVLAYAKKENTTPLYVYVTNIINGDVGFYGAAYGYDAEGDYKGNFTMYNGNYVPEVVLFEGMRQSVRSGIYERLNGQGTCYAAPAFRCSIYLSQETIFQGKWSPDSTRVYTVAQPE